MTSKNKNLLSEFQMLEKSPIGRFYIDLFLAFEEFDRNLKAEKKIVDKNSKVSIPLLRHSVKLANKHR